MEHVQAADVQDGMLNVGCGEDQTIRELAELVQRVVGHTGEIVWDAERPDGTPRKLMDVSRLRGLGWAPTVSLEDGIGRAYGWFLKNRA
jgi:GDP-L-fucose synthase